MLYTEIEKRKTADKNNPIAKANKNEGKKISSNKEKHLSNVNATDSDEQNIESTECISNRENWKEEMKNDFDDFQEEMSNLFLKSKKANL